MSIHGLSPPTRGNPYPCHAKAAHHGSIPAHAGEPGGDDTGGRQRGVYPCPRGGTPAGGRSGARGRRSIPAHAGEPPRILSSPVQRWVYPCPRGGTPRFPRCAAVPPRSIPAHAGEPPTPPTCTESAGGLSPPTRGNRIPKARTGADIGSIPAHAGEPPALLRAYTRDDGSIPAHAGEPNPGDGLAFDAAVYPRPRGGTWHTHPRRVVLAGLSPPTRGNLRRQHERRLARGSIPAHAGDPSAIQGDEGRPAVYPRPRGGTLAWNPNSIAPTGLSPPTRGNLPDEPRDGGLSRSIPAHAGEPAGAFGAPPVLRVYPRPRGGTLKASCATAKSYGLSPPTPGNPFLKRLHADRVGSIPAHAGEPPAVRIHARAGGVYPRPRGGTSGCRQPPSGRQWSIPAHAGEPSRIAS